jgi:uncharacterized membrane protein
MTHKKQIIYLILGYFVAIFLLALLNKILKVEVKFLFFLLTGIMGGYLTTIISKK